MKSSINLLPKFLFIAILFTLFSSTVFADKNKNGWIYYRYISGEDSAKVRFEEGKIKKVVLFYKNGMKEAELNWQGKPPKLIKEGYDKYYYPNGKLKEIAYYSKNLKTKFSIFREDGKLLRKGQLIGEEWDIQEFELPPIEERYKIQVGLNSN